MTSLWKFHVGISAAPYWIHRSALASVGVEGHLLNIEARITVGHLGGWQAYLSKVSWFGVRKAQSVFLGAGI